MLGWNRGLGDIALGLYAIVHRIREMVPEVEITFLVRENLLDGFSMLRGVKAVGAPGWKRGERVDVRRTLGKLGIDPGSFDLIVEEPSPTDWCRWQRGVLTPKLEWNEEWDELWKRFDLPDGFVYVGVQLVAETSYGLWRNWPMERWIELLDRLKERGNVRVLLFGFGSEPKVEHPNVIDLRGKTSLFELLSIVKNRCSGLVLPDSGILSMTYYLDATFPIRLVSLWGDPDHGILKQRVDSPNGQLVHVPQIGKLRDLSSVSAGMVEEALFPRRERKPWREWTWMDGIGEGATKGAACVILAGGQGSRLGFEGPKGLFPVLNKSLFEYLCEKTAVEMPIAVMTSPLNEAETIDFFRKKEFFGRRVHFFQQTVVPLLDERYREVGVAPDGNGCVFQRLVESGLVDQFEREGIDTVLIIPVENPLADPSDRKLIGHRRSVGADVVVKCIARKVGESMGVLVEEEGRVRVAEYVELTGEELESREFSLAYTGQMAVSLPFVRRAARVQLPYHWIKKKGAWKRERFLFDAWEAAEKISVVCYPREMCYAPVKGMESLGKVEEALRGL